MQRPNAARQRATPVSPRPARTRGPQGRARRRAPPGGSAYLAAGPTPRRRPAGDGRAGRRRRAPRGRRPTASAPPLPLPGHQSPRSGPGGAAGVRSSGLSPPRPLPRSRRVRLSFTRKSLRHRNPTGGQGRPGGPRRGGSAAAAGEGGRECARGGWPATGSRRLDLLVSQLRRRGAEEPVLPKTDRKWVTERPGQR